MHPNNFQNIIFDLGGVILNIDYQKTADSFREMSLTSFEDLYSQATQNDLFDRFEVGEISAQHFVNKMLTLLPVNTSANKVVRAWNAMLLDFPQENLDFLREIKKHKQTFLLSNTNEIHVQTFNRKLREQTGESNLNTYFNEVYFSNEIGKRKPHPETFQYICDLNKLVPSETLFIDDSIQHIEGAKKIGLQTIHLQKGEKLTEILKLNL